MALDRALLGGPSTSPLDGMGSLSAKPRACFRAVASIGAASITGFGCVSKENLTVWDAQVPSPDGRWVASADTVQNGGFGSAYIATSVYLQRAGESRPRVAVLEFSCRGPMPRPYALDNVANAGGSIHLTLKWIDPSHLHVTYDAHPTIIFQAIRLQDVNISVQELSGGTGDKRT